MTLDAVGGVWRYAVDTARGLNGLGIACRLVGFGPPPDAAKIAECRSLPNTDLVWADAPLDWMVADDAALRPVTQELIRLASAWQPDLLHLNLPTQAAGLPAGWPVVVVSHSCVPTWWQSVRAGVLPESWDWLRRRNASGFERADMVLVPSASHGAALQKAYGKLSRLRVLQNGTSASPSAGGQEKFVLAAGRWWDEAKNAACLDAAAAHIRWPVVMAGPLGGPDGTETMLLHARSAGPLAPAALGATMRRAAMFAAPSRYEPFGLAVLEAAMSGAALVLADIPTFRELWGDVAVFVPTTDHLGWAAAINALSEDADRRTGLAARSQLRAIGMTIDRQARCLAECYTDIVAQYAKAGAA